MLFLGLSAKPSAQSFSSLSSEASKTSKMGSSSTPTAASPPTNDAGLYEKLLWSHQHDPKSKEDLVLNRRVGFYRFKSDIGAGNFSKVKLAQHQLTKGMLNQINNNFRAQMISFDTFFNVVMIVCSRNPLAKVCMYLVSGSKLTNKKKIGTIILNEGKRLESCMSIWSTNFRDSIVRIFIYA